MKYNQLKKVLETASSLIDRIKEDEPKSHNWIEYYDDILKCPFRFILDYTDSEIEWYDDLVNEVAGNKKEDDLTEEDYHWIDLYREEQTRLLRLRRDFISENYFYLKENNIANKYELANFKPHIEGSSTCQKLDTRLS